MRFALRQLFRKPGFTLAAMLTVALGIGVCAIVTSITEAVLLRPMPYPDSDRLVEMRESHRSEDVLETHGVSLPNYRDWRERSRAFSHLGFLLWANPWVTDGTQTRRVSGHHVSADFFPALGVRPTAGRVFTAEEENRGDIVVLSVKLWRQQFGASAFSPGRTIVVNDRVRTVLGVMPDGFSFPGRTDLWLALGDDEALSKARHDRSWRLGYVIGRLQPEATHRQATEAMNDLARQLAKQYPGDNGDWGVRVFSLRDRLTGPSRKALPILWTAAGFILAIAGANLTNLMTARMIDRRREFSIRACLGAGRWQLSKPWILECTLVALFGVITALVVVVASREWLDAYVESHLPRFAEWRLGWITLAVSLGAAILTGVVCGIMSIWRGRRHERPSMFAVESCFGTMARDGRRLLSGLVVGQLSLAIALLVGAGLALRTYYDQIHPTLEANPKQVLAVEIDLPKMRYPTAAAQLEFHDQLLARIRAWPDVRQAGAASFLEFNHAMRSPITLEGDTEGGSRPWRWTYASAVSPGFFPALQWPLLRGRDLNEQDTVDRPEVAVINQTMAQSYWPGRDPLGQRFASGDNTNHGPWITVVGVVSDLRRRGDFRDGERPTYYRPCRQMPYLGVIVVQSTGNTTALSARLQALSRRLDPTLPPSKVTSLQEVILDAASDTWSLGRELTFLAALALGLALVGVYGVFTHTVALRRREFGLRMALGARRIDIVRSVLVWGGRLALMATVVGLILAWGTTRLLSGLLAGIELAEPFILLAVILLLGLAVFLACVFPAFRAASVHPMEALRHE